MSGYVSPYLNPRQARTRAPTEWEEGLADAIEAAFSSGAWKLDELIAHLNRSRVRHPSGEAWTADNFTKIMRELGA